MITLRCESIPENLHVDARYVQVIEDPGLAVFEHPPFNTDRLREIVLACKTPRPSFNVVSIQTVTGCNAVCSFCPINQKHYLGGQRLMNWSLLDKIAGELGDLRYEDEILLFTNNEPFLDDRMADIVRLFRERCPGALLKILTNGTLLTKDLTRALFQAGLTNLTINNYTDGVRIIGPVKQLLSEAQDFVSYNVLVLLRRANQILSTRAGQAPNRPSEQAGLSHGFCALPFTDLTIAADGRVTQCCFDALAYSDFGNVMEASLQEVWVSDCFEELRVHLAARNRGGNPLCTECDFDGFRTPFHHSRPFVRSDLDGERRSVESISCLDT